MMELDVHITRKDDESWGFRLIGGVDFGMPLTVVKVIPDSPADKAGLQNGDTVCRINGTVACDLSHDQSRKAVAGATDYLTLGVTRGLYDPVLDDQEPIFLDPEDFDQPSHPTEVPFHLSEFTDIAPTLNGYPQIQDPRKLSSQNGYPEQDPQNLSQSRSLTASPFVLPEKPYRPFSTEPLPNVPPLEDPIILNPDYYDLFGKLGVDEDFLPKTKFKLPISEQYDPDGTKKQRSVSRTTDIASKETTEEKRIQITEKEKVDVKFMENMKKDIDMEKIEITATSIVDESLQKAVTVAEEIKKEMNSFLETCVSSLSSTDLVESSTNKEYLDAISEKIESSKQESMTSEKAMKEVNQLVELLDLTSEDILKKSEAKVKEVAQKFENLEMKHESVDERKQCIKQEIEETIQAGSVKQKSSALDEKKNLQENVQTRQSTEESKVKDVKASKIESFESSQTSEQSKTSVKMSTSRLLAEQRAYTMGLKTIPNIRGTVHSSYHYDLLLKTFFIHLTDVMVALSRFILAEPVLKPAEEDEVKKDVTEEKVVQTTEKEEKIFEKAKDVAETVIKEDKIELAKVDHKIEKVAVQALEKRHEEKQEERKVGNYYAYDETMSDSVEGELIEKKLLTGAEMAQLSEKKSEQLTQIMDAVISEFEHKAGIEESEEKLAIRERRSRSRSRVKDDISSEAQIEARKIIEEYTEGKITSSKSSLETTQTSLESRHETRDHKSSKYKEGKQYYIATVESHVYTNKDTILEEQLSETSSVQSTDETKLAIEALSTQKVAIESSKLKESIKETKQEVKAQVIEEKQPQELKTEIAAVRRVELKPVEEVLPPIETREVKPIVSEETTTAMAESTDVISEAKKTAFQEKAIEIKQNIAKEKTVKKEDALAKDVVIVKKEAIKPAIKEESFAKQETLSYKEEKVTPDEKTMVKEESAAMKEVLSEAKSEAITEEAIETKQAVSMKEESKVKEQAIIDIADLKSISIKEDIVQKEDEAIKEESFKIDQTIAKSTKVDEVKSAVIIEEVIAKEAVTVIEESYKHETATAEITEVKEVKSVAVKEDAITIKQDIPKPVIKEDEFAELKVTKEEIVDDTSVQIVDVTESESKSYTFESDVQEYKTEEYESTYTAQLSSQIEESFTAKLESTSIESRQSVQESNFVAQSTESYKREGLKLDLKPDRVEIDTKKSFGSDTDIKTPTPATVPPTPLTDEYMFQLEIPLPKSRGTTPVPRDCTPTPEDEDPHIVKKFLVPHIDTKVEEQIIYDPPLPTPPGSKVTSPVYTKPGLRGGADRREVFKKKKEEILEIERTSSLLASAIDQTIKSIEEYKEEVGIENKKQTENNGLIYNGYAKIIETKVFNTDKFENHIMDDSKTHIQDSKKQAADTKTNGVDMNGYSEVRLAVIDHDFEVNNNENKIDKVNEEIKKLESEVLMNNIEAVPVTIDERKVEIEEPKVDISDPKPEIDEPRVEIPDISHLLTPDREIGKKDPMEGYRPVQFDLEELKNVHRNLRPVYNTTNGEQKPKREMYKSETGEMLGTHQGIVDGLEEAVVDDDVAKELGKPGIPEEKIAELISGESEMLREAHVMGLSRVLSSHMHRANDDDSSVDFNKIKPVLESLKDSEVLKALNEELKRTREETKKKEERNWTTFLLKPERPVPKVKSGYHGWVDQEQNAVESYKVKIVKQPKPKIAPDYKPEVFETGLLPWEERALREPTPPPVEPEEPILIPEEPPEVFEAVDPLPESEVPDLEDSGIPLPPPKPIEEPPQEEEEKEEAIELDLEAVIEETEKIVEENLEEEMDQVKIADQLMMSVQNMVDPNAPLEQQLAQMRAQLAALAQLPCVIQQSLELVTRQLTQLSQMESSQTTKQSETTEMKEEEVAEEVAQNNCAQIEVAEETQKQEEQQIGMEEEKVEEDVKPTVTDVKPTITAEELERMKREEEAMMDEQRKIEKQKKELMEQMRVEQESRQLKHRATPRVGKPKPVFGPATPQERPLVLPGGRKWRKPKDAYNEAFIAETLTAQAEIIQGKAKGCSFESARLPYDERINFLKYEKPPVSLDHLHNSDTYKMVHDMEQAPLKRVEMRTPVICEADYREKCRSVTPCMDFPQQVRP